MSGASVSSAEAGGDEAKELCHRKMKRMCQRGDFWTGSDRTAESCGGPCSSSWYYNHRRYHEGHRHLTPADVIVSICVVEQVEERFREYLRSDHRAPNLAGD